MSNNRENGSGNIAGRPQRHQKSFCEIIDNRCRDKRIRLNRTASANILLSVQVSAARTNNTFLNHHGAGLSRNIIYHLRDVIRLEHLVGIFLPHAFWPNSGRYCTRIDINDVDSFAPYFGPENIHHCLNAGF